MTDLPNLLAAAHTAADREEGAKAALKECKGAREDAYAAYNAARLEHAGLREGMIVEAPHRYSWDRARGKTETLAVTGVSTHKLGFALGRVVTKTNKLHRGQYSTVAFDIEGTKDTGRVLVSD